MKKLISSLCILLLILTTSCKNETKTSVDSEKETTEKTINYTIKPEATSIAWTAYKTTEKVPVTGNFTVVKFSNKTGNTPTEALHGLQFSIPVSSIFSKNEDRDNKLKKSFFGAMLDTSFLKGSISCVNTNDCKASITMNGETHDLPLKYTLVGNKLNLHGIINLENWKANVAIASLNKVCFDLHKGADGISKTWNEVVVDITTTLSN